MAAPIGNKDLVFSVNKMNEEEKPKNEVETSVSPETLHSLKSWQPDPDCPFTQKPVELKRKELEGKAEVDTKQAKGNPQESIKKEDIFSIIRGNLQSALKAVEDSQWGSSTVALDTKPGFFSFFERVKGNIHVLSTDFYENPKDHGLEGDFVRLGFTYEWTDRVHFFRRDLENVALSILASKILLATEKLFSACHSFDSKIFNEGVLFSATLLKTKLKAVIADDKKVQEAWDAVNEHTLVNYKQNLDLLDMHYSNHVSDIPWDDTIPLKEKQIVVIRRSDKSLRFGLIAKIDNEIVEVMVKNIPQYESKKIPVKALGNSIKYIW